MPIRIGIIRTLVVVMVIGGFIFMSVPFPVTTSVHTPSKGNITAIENVFVTMSVLIPTEAFNQKITIDLISYEREFTLTVFNQSEHDRFVNGLHATPIYNVTGTRIQTVISLEPSTSGWVVITLISRDGTLDINGDIFCDYSTPYYLYALGMFSAAAILFGFILYKER